MGKRCTNSGSRQGRRHPPSNGEIESDFEPEWSTDENEPAQINYKGEYQFLVMGWGHLTGCGNAMNLPAEIAEKMQDGFIAYIINRLNNVKTNITHETI